MHLTDDEKSMLDGNEGKTVQYAMECLVQLGEAFDAEKMVEISYAHVHTGMGIYKGDVERVEQLADGKTKVKVPSSTHPIWASLHSLATRSCSSGGDTSL